MVHAGRLTRLGALALMPVLFALDLGHEAGRQVQATGAAGIHAQGNRLLDGADNPIVLHGVNRSGTEYACVHGPGFADGPTDDASVQAMRAWQINAVRVPLNEDCWLGINGVAVGGAAYQQDIETWVTTLTRNGMVVILDLHWNAPGALMAVGQQPMADADHAPAFWRGVAAAFMGNGNVILDLYNEPDPIPYRSGFPGGFSAWQNSDFSCVRDGCAATATQGGGFQTAGMQALVNAVRATGAANLILIGGIQDAQTVTQYLGDADTPGSFLPHDPLGNLAVATHMYAGDACANSACWNDVIAPVALRYPVIVGEFGDTNCTAALTTALLPWLDGQGISYLGWNWGSDFGCQSLIRDYSGLPTSPYGQAYKNHLAALTSSTPPATATQAPATATATTSASTTPAGAATSTPSATTTPIAPATITATTTATPTGTPAQPTATPTARATVTPTAPGRATPSSTPTPRRRRFPS